MKHFSLLICITFLFSSIGFSQKKSLDITGEVINEEGPVKNALIKVFIDDSLIASDRTGGNGRFEFDLPLGKNYFIVTQKLKHYNKWISLESEGVSSIDLSHNFRFGTWEIFLIKEEEGLEKIELLNAGRVFYDKYKRSFDWEKYDLEIPKEVLELAQKTEKNNLQQTLSNKKQQIEANSTGESKTKQLTDIKVIDFTSIDHNQFSLVEYHLKWPAEEFKLKEVKYHWGGRFYFKDELPIKEQEFRGYLDKINKTELASYTSK